LRYTNKGRQGDGFPCELRLDFLDATKNPPETVSRVHPWVISGTDWDPAAKRGEQKQLEDERRERHIRHMLGRIQGELHKTGSVLVREAGSLVKKPASKST